MYIYGVFISLFIHFACVLVSIILVNQKVFLYISLLQHGSY